MEASEQCMKSVQTFNNKDIRNPSSTLIWSKLLTFNKQHRSFVSIVDFEQVDAG